MIRRTLIALLFTAVALSACAGSRDAGSQFAAGSTWGTQQLIDAARDAAYDSMKESNRGKAKNAAMRSREFAERCLMAAPENAGCYYWRAVATGLYYRVHVLGYQTGVKSMISDCEKVLSLDPRYDHAGADRVLGELYLKLPQSTGRPDSVVRDLDLAEQHLRRAVQRAPDYPENHLILAELLIQQEKTSEALDELSVARNLTPQWKSDVSYNDWKSTTVALERKIHKK